MSEEIVNIELETDNEHKSMELITLEDDRSQRYLTDVKKAKFLPKVLEERIAVLAPELNHVFKTQTIWRTETEIRCSVLNDMNFPDNASKYHQAKLEQLVFFEQLLHLSFDFRKLQENLIIKETEIEELEEKLENINLKSWERKRLEAKLSKKNIEREELTYDVQNMQIQAKERVREIDVWSRVKEELDDGSFDKDNKDQNQLISLTRRYITEASRAVQVGRNGDISSYNNIIAQFEMLVKECHDRGILVEVLEVFGLDSQIVKWVLEYFGLQLSREGEQEQPPIRPQW